MKVNSISANSKASSVVNDTFKGISPQKSFQSDLMEATYRITSEKLDTLLAEIDVLSKKIKEKPELRSLIEYKKLIKEFMEEVIKGYKYSKKESIDSRGRRRVYGIVEKVDRKLEEMMQNFLDDQHDKIRIINLIDEIRGMLIDLYT